MSPQPSLNPSNLPTQFPTFENLSSLRGTFRQDFIVPPDPDDGGVFLNPEETVLFVQVLQNYTAVIFPGAVITTECELEPQASEPRGDPPVQITVLDYSCLLTSRTFVVTDYSELFLATVNGNLVSFAERLRSAGVDVTSADIVRQRQIQTEAPTFSSMPTAIPSDAPTVSPMPTNFPTGFPTLFPTLAPAIPPQSTAAPITPTPAPMESESRSLAVGVVAGITISVGLAVLAGLYMYYRAWSKQKARQNRGSTTTMSDNRAFGPVVPWGNQEQSVPGDHDDVTDRNVPISPAESIKSKQSLVSSGAPEFGVESGDEADGTGKLKDEFDQWKDPNVEQVRVDVEDNLTGFEGIMSQAVTRALMGDEGANVDMQELLWGCDPNPSGAEIEASALHEVFDWLKRNDGADTQRKRAFMQEVLNRMVTSVRYGVLEADDASRTIHESAALLGLQLVNKLPTATLIISGMQKTTTALDMIRTLAEFGDISEAAVASGRRGFGLVRFSRNSSVERAMQRYRSAEIEILDVNIQMKVISKENTLVEQ